MIFAMFSASPRSGEINAEAYLAMVELGCSKVDDAAIQEAVADAALGAIPGMQRGWGPSYDVFNAHAIKLGERNKLVRDYKSRPAIEAPKQDIGRIRQEGTEESRKARVAAILKQASGAGS